MERPGEILARALSRKRFDLFATGFGEMHALRPQTLVLAPEIPDADIDNDEAGKDQRDRKLGLRTRLEGRNWLLPIGGWSAEGGDVVRARCGRAGSHLRRRAAAAHLRIIGLVHQADGRFGRVLVAHLAEQGPIFGQKVLGFGGERRGAVQLGNHLPGREIGAGPCIGTSRNQHIRSFRQVGLGSSQPLQLGVTSQNKNEPNDDVSRGL